MLISRIQNRSEYNEILDNVRTIVINAIQIHIKRIARYRTPLPVFIYVRVQRTEQTIGICGYKMYHIIIIWLNES